MSLGGGTLTGALYVKDRLNVNGADPYIGTEGPTRSLVISGGGGWTSTGSTIALYGASHASQAGNMMIQGADTGTRALTMTGWNSVYFNVRPSFNGGTPWDTLNFNPAGKADASNWNSAGVAANISATKGFFSGTNNLSTIANQSGAAALEVRAPDASPGAAFMQFHRPGAYATNFGLDSDNRLKIGGWSYGGSSDNIWHNKNIPNDSWQKSVDGTDRFYFGANSTSYFGTPANSNWVFRRTSDGLDALTLTGGGAATFAHTVVAQGGIYTNGNEVSVRGTNPTIFLRDTDHRSAMIHVNNNTFHVLRGAGNDTSAWETVNGRWPMTINLETNDATFGGHLDARTHVYAGNNVYAGNEVYAGNWFRVQGANTGIYWEQHGGGIQMTDSSWLRVYNGKSFVCEGTIQGGNVIATSDGRLKHDVTPIKDATAMLDAVEPVNFTWNESKRSSLGFIAQELQKVDERFVQEGADGFLAVEPTALIAALWGAVKELRDEVRQLRGDA